jgi:hypothetical protein
MVCQVMKRKSNFIAVFTFCFFVAIPAVVPQTKPDLAVTAVRVTADGTGQYFESVAVSVKNACDGTVASQSFLLLTFRETERKDSKSIYYVGNRVPRLRGGEGHTQAFGFASQKISIATHLLVEVDPYDKVSETDENNNWQTVNPNGSAKGTRCGTK